MKMNLPNKLTLIRVMMVPVFVVVYELIPLAKIPLSLLATVLFVLACVTDFLDGQIARKYHLVTNFGKFMDPLADKLLVGAAILCFLGAGLVPAWAAIILIGREFIISGFRLVAAGKKIVIAADIWGKTKTVVQMVAIILLLLPIEAAWFRTVGLAVFYLSVGLAVISVINYIVSNPEVLRESNE